MVIVLSPISRIYTLNEDVAANWEYDYLRRGL